MNVMDMSDPTNPTLTARLLTPAMDTPHESLVLSRERGLLAAVAGNLTTNVGQIDIYDISGDCRQPELRSSTPMGFLGHESGLSPDGNTFYSASPVEPDDRGRGHLESRRCRSRSGSATTTRTGCRSAPTATAPTSPAPAPG